MPLRSIPPPPDRSGGHTDHSHGDNRRHEETAASIGSQSRLSDSEPPSPLSALGEAGGAHTDSEPPSPSTAGSAGYGNLRGPTPLTLGDGVGDAGDPRGGASAPSPKPKAASLADVDPGGDVRLVLLDPSTGEQRPIVVNTVDGRKVRDAADAFDRIDELTAEEGGDGTPPTVTVAKPELDVRRVLSELRQRRDGLIPREVLAAEVQAAQDAVTVAYIELNLAQQQLRETQAAESTAKLNWMREWIGKTAGRLLERVDACKGKLQVAEGAYDNLRAKLVFAVAPEIGRVCDAYSTAYAHMVEHEGDAIESVMKLTTHFAAAARARHAPNMQTLSEATARELYGDEAAAAGVQTNDSRYLLGLMDEARECEPRLAALCYGVSSNVQRAGGSCSAVRGPMKTLKRSLQKAKEEYQSNYTLLKDLTRAALECRELADVEAVLTELKVRQERGELNVTRVKNRLSPRYDADEGGGYRDYLINLQMTGSHHIAEVQIHLHSFLGINQSGGHSVYRAARQAHAFDTATCEYMGAPSAHVCEKAAMGVLRKLDVGGADVRPELQQQLAECINTPTCRLVSLIAASCDLPVDVAEFVTPSSCAKLYCLNLNSCKVNGSLPSHISCVRSLEYLSLTGNELSGPLPTAVGDLPYLKELRMHTNKLCGPIPTSIGRLKRLNILHLFGNRMTGIIPEELCECVALTDLQVSRNEFEGPIPQGLGRLTQVRTCYLGQNFLQGPIPDSIGNLSSVTDLQFAKNMLSGPLPESISKLSQLKKLYVWSNKLTGPLIPALGALTSAVDLQLSRNCFTGPFPAELSALKRLKTLYLHTNKLTGALPDMSSLASIERLDLSVNAFNGAIPASLGKCKRLRILRIFANQLGGAVPDTLGECTALEELSLSRNRLDGTLPPALGALSRLKVLYTYSNRLTGPIPDALAQCTALEDIQVSKNGHSGHVPDLSALTRLKTLWLDENALTGNIGESALSRLTSLETLHAEENDFVVSTQTAEALRLSLPRLRNFRV